MDEVLERGIYARYAKSAFFEEYNDIDIFIEDTSKEYEKIYVEIFSRVFGSSYKVSNVFPLGGKRSVIQRRDESRDQLVRPTLFVVDGDLELINGISRSGDGLYSLPFYCIENILIDHEAIYSVLNEENIDKGKSTLVSQFDYQGWIENNATLLIQLFVEYGVAHALCPDMQTVSYEISKLLSSNTGDLDERKVNERIQEFSRQIIDRMGEDAYHNCKNSVLTRINEAENNALCFVSAKDYILPLLLIRLRKVTGSKTPHINIKLRLAMRCDVSGIVDSANYVVSGSRPAPHEVAAANSQ